MSNKHGVGTRRALLGLCATDLKHQWPTRAMTGNAHRSPKYQFPDGEVDDRSSSTTVKGRKCEKVRSAHHALREGERGKTAVRRQWSKARDYKTRAELQEGGVEPNPGPPKKQSGPRIHSCMIECARRSRDGTHPVGGKSCQPGKSCPLAELIACQKSAPHVTPCSFHHMLDESGAVVPVCRVLFDQEGSFGDVRAAPGEVQDLARDSSAPVHPPTVPVQAVDPSPVVVAGTTTTIEISAAHLPMRSVSPPIAIVPTAPPLPPPGWKSSSLQQSAFFSGGRMHYAIPTPTPPAPVLGAALRSTTLRPTHLRTIPPQAPVPIHPPVPPPLPAKPLRPLDGVRLAPGLGWRKGLFYLSAPDLTVEQQAPDVRPVADRVGKHLPDPFYVATHRIVHYHVPWRVIFGVLLLLTGFAMLKAYWLVRPKADAVVQDVLTWAEVPEPCIDWEGLSLQAFKEELSARIRGSFSSAVMRVLSHFPFSWAIYLFQFIGFAISWIFSWFGWVVVVGEWFRAVQFTGQYYSGRCDQFCLNTLGEWYGIESMHNNPSMISLIREVFEEGRLSERALDALPDRLKYVSDYLRIYTKYAVSNHRVVVGAGVILSQSYIKGAVRGVHDIGLLTVTVLKHPVMCWWWSWARLLIPICLVFGFRIFRFAYVPNWVTGAYTGTATLTEADALALCGTKLKMAGQINVIDSHAHDYVYGSLLAFELLISAYRFTWTGSRFQLPTRPSQPGGVGSVVGF